ncbi:MAG: sigma-70 family RNA polymerase sigma factor [Lentisphaeraceae bacterium]|nr:sigma-70 family RNA polymerase sigma factor [Lentisphaeraceae bacterium]
MSDDFQWNTRQTMLLRLRDKHDDDSWEEFVSYYKQYIYNIVRYMKLNHHDATEIVQLVIIKLWKKLPTFKYDEHRGRFRNWLHTVTANQVKDFLRKKGAALSHIPDPEKMKEESYINGVSLPEIESIAEREWKTYISNLAWERLQKTFTKTVCDAFMLMIEGYDGATVAQKLDIAESSVYVYKKRVQDRLKKEIGILNSELG